MRIIKLRSWNKKEKKFVYLTISKLSLQLSDKLEIVKDEDLENWQLYTGLHDKKSKEIYEGDILKGGVGNVVNVGSVVFDRGAFWWAIKGWDISAGGLVGNISEFTKVIGNIYENPKLLERDYEKSNN